MRYAFPPYPIRSKRTLLLAIGLGVTLSSSAHATGVAGDRLFPSTLLIEDTQNDDELALPTVSWLRRGANGDTPAGRDLAIGGEYSRLLTDDLAASVSTGRHRLDAAGGRRFGWDNLDLGLKYRTLVNEPQELLISTGVFTELGGTGAARIGAERFSTVQPVVSFGKGFGDLPRDVDWLRPVAVSGALGLALPTGAAAKTVRYGISLQYSLYYRDRRIAPGTMPEWARSLIPLVEFAAETPAGRSYGGRTLATAAPGIVWMGDAVQLTVEALIPLNRHTGSGLGAIAQAHFFLDEMLPSVFGKPLFDTSSPAAPLPAAATYEAPTPTAAPRAPKRKSDDDD